MRVASIMALAAALAAMPAGAECTWEWLCNGEGLCKHVPICDRVTAGALPGREFLHSLPPLRRVCELCARTSNSGD